MGLLHSVETWQPSFKSEYPFVKTIREEASQRVLPWYCEGAPNSMFNRRMEGDSREGKIWKVWLVYNMANQNDLPNHIPSPPAIS